MGDALTQIAQPVDNGHAGTDQLLQVKSEINDLVTRHADATEFQHAAPGVAEIDQVEPQLRQTQLEVGEIGGIDGAAHHLALLVHGFIFERRCHLWS